MVRVGSGFQANNRCGWHPTGGSETAVVDTAMVASLASRLGGQGGM